MKRISLTFALLAACCVSGYAQSWTPSASQIEELEAKIQLDKLLFWKISKLPLLPGYERFYAGSVLNGDRVILGELIVPFGKKKSGIHIVPSPKNFPEVYDGACSVVHVVYSEKRKTITSLTCNGRG